MAAASKAWTVFALSNAGIVGSIPTQGMDICLCLFCVCVVLCVGSGLATGWSPVHGVLPSAKKKMITELSRMSNEYGIKNNKKGSGNGLIWGLIPIFTWRNGWGLREISARRVGVPGKFQMSSPHPFNQHKSDAIPSQPTCSVLPEEKKVFSQKTLYE
jgi:hypothetical protein